MSYHSIITFRDTGCQISADGISYQSLGSLHPPSSVVFVPGCGIINASHLPPTLILIRSALPFTIMVWPFVGNMFSSGTSFPALNPVQFTMPAADEHDCILKTSSKDWSSAVSVIAPSSLHWRRRC